VIIEEKKKLGTSNSTLELDIFNNSFEQILNSFPDNDESVFSYSHRNLSLTS